MVTLSILKPLNQIENTYFSKSGEKPATDSRCVLPPGSGTWGLLREIIISFPSTVGVRAHLRGLQVKVTRMARK
jgi:hypothetical protein